MPDPGRTDATTSSIDTGALTQLTPPAPKVPSSSRVQVAAADVPGINSLLTLAVGVVVIAALYFGRDVLVPITLAVLLSFVLAPVVELMQRIYVPRAPSVVLAVLLALGVILATGSMIASQLAGLAEELPRYQTTISAKVDTIRGMTVGRISRLVGTIGRQVEAASKPDQAATPGAAAAPATAAPVPVEVRAPDLTPFEMATRVLTPVVKPLETIVIVLLVTIFILLQREDLRDRMIRLFGSKDLHRTTGALDEAGQRLSRYFLFQLGLNTLFGSVVSAALFAIGIPSPLLFGIMAGLLRFVPYVGSLLAAALPILLAAAVDPGWDMVLWTVALFAVTEPLMGQVVEPMVYGHSTGLSPVSVVIAAIFWTWLWGPIGLLLATPLTLCLVVLGRHVDRLEFLDVMLGDRPALTPVESFYQRMLAGDPDEAHEQADQLLKERPLSSYYDEVALKGLKLAANDATRGVLNEVQVELIKDSICELVEDLGAQHKDVQPTGNASDAAPTGLTLAEKAVPKAPPPGKGETEEPTVAERWRAPRAVLCVAGRGPLDEAANTMLAQLLGKHGIGVELAPHEAVSRANIGRLDPDGIAMVCISYLEVAGTPTHLRYLLRRVRQQLPGIPVLVGLWPAEDATLNDDRLRTVLSADHYVSSLRDAVNACLTEAHKDGPLEQSHPAAAA